ncbi:MAG: BrnT family toxin [Chloroflexi bacterium]|nr:BrnT family toxin [Chloroflexota bacterium]
MTELILLRTLRDKLEVKHGVLPEEIEEILLGRPVFRRGEKGRRNRNEHLHYALGQAEDGRYLIVVFILKPGNQALVISARDMTERERRSYRRFRP